MLFSILMNRTSPASARDAQDRMASAISSSSGATIGEIVDEVSVTAPTGGTVPATLGAPADFGAFTPLDGPATLLTFGGPVSNDAVQIGFRQAIDASTPLRAGRYETSLVFTLSTTSP